MSALKSWLAHPLTRDLELDDPRTTEVRRAVIADKPFLKRIYEEWYARLIDGLPRDVEGPVLELGSGAGFLPDMLPGVITSEVFHCPWVEAVLDGQQMPFRTASLRAILMTDVFHHVPDAAAFLREASRVLKPGGKILMVEPWVTAWSRQIYTRFHHEPFLPDATDWPFAPGGPLTGANGALPWLVFERDRVRFEREIPTLRIAQVTPFMPLRYLAAGGVSMRGLTPDWSFPLWRVLERAVSPLRSQFAMFGFIELVRTDAP